jgi:hypothetical protein
MSKKRNVRAKSAQKGRRFSIPMVVSIVVIAAAAITVVSRQVVTGQDVPVNQKTGELKPLTPQEAQKMAAGLKGMLNRSSQGLVAVKQPDGSTSMDLQGRFQNVAVARIADDGSVTTSCVDNPKAAADFFDIDPQLLGVASTNKPSNQATRSARVKSPRQ